MCSGITLPPQTYGRAPGASQTSEYPCGGQFVPLARLYPRLARCCVRAARVACSFVLVCEFPEAFTAVFEDDDGDIDEVARAFFLAEAPGTAAADIDDDERSFAIRRAPCLCGIGVPPGG